MNSISENYDETNNYTQPMNNTESIKISESIYIGEQFPLKDNITTCIINSFILFSSYKSREM